MTDHSIARRQLGGAVHQRSALSATGALERIFSGLFTGLVYAQIWEDPVVDMQALELGPGDRLVCIASGGCNMMSYLAAGPAGITAVDLSPAHVALNRLKLAAARTLPGHAEFYEFFGHADRPGNPALYDRYIAPGLDAESRAFWEARQGRLRRRIDMFAHGFYRYGVLGRFIAAAHLVAGLGRVDFRPLLAARNLEDQRAFFEAEVAPLFETRGLRFIARRRASLFGLGIPPAQFDKLAAEGGGDIVPVLRERTRKLICDFPISENYFAWAAFNRGYRPDGTGPVPPYLEAANWDALRAGAGRVEVLNRNLTDMLAGKPDASQDAYVLLDAQDWMTDAQLNALWSQITRTARPGARVIFRTGGAPDILPGRVADATLRRWTSDPGAGQLFWQRDRSAIYGGFHRYTFRK
ncbi:DUF3419 family protein [Mangrovicoccus algicola]|uniref:DUF3419 family protein n=1 Tax=Mangrovicoccus algicola TaxID=2771008 RepID=A0A8J6Z4K5_9RHOB|nr:DUF3419 family protein [Mangrovicoccus algicola]MBE3637509.1 DUF3419 family protein [Mangrovicoccus algicola]